MGDEIAAAHCGDFEMGAARGEMSVRKYLGGAKLDMGGDSGSAESAPKMRQKGFVAKPAQVALRRSVWGEITHRC